MDVLHSVLAAYAIVALYLLPSFLSRYSTDFQAIFLANIIFGITIIGWIAILIWAFRAKTSSPMTKALRDAYVDSGRWSDPRSPEALKEYPNTASNAFAGLPVAIALALSVAFIIVGTLICFIGWLRFQSFMISGVTSMLVGAGAVMFGSRQLIRAIERRNIKR